MPVDRRGLHRGQGLPGRADEDLRRPLRRLRSGQEQGLRNGGAHPGIAEGQGADGAPPDLLQARIRTGRHERTQPTGSRSSSRPRSTSAAAGSGKPSPSTRSSR
ncbi:MAG: hypothetical protein MZV64_13115 [Ignavibacteriales bacterium]|nr:hypothetical protein [Ignavibacteriales bacterium]